MFRSGLDGLPVITDKDGAKYLPPIVILGAASGVTTPPTSSPVPFRLLLLSWLTLGSGVAASGPGFADRQLKDLRITADRGSRVGDNGPEPLTSPSLLKIDVGREIVLPKSIDKRLADLRSFLTSFRAPLSWPLSSVKVTAFSPLTLLMMSEYGLPEKSMKESFVAVNVRFRPLISSGSLSRWTSKLRRPESNEYLVWDSGGGRNPRDDWRDSSG